MAFHSMFHGYILHYCLQSALKKITTHPKATLLLCTPNVDNHKISASNEGVLITKVLKCLSESNQLPFNDKYLRSANVDIYLICNVRIKVFTKCKAFWESSSIVFDQVECFQRTKGYQQLFHLVKGKIKENKTYYVFSFSKMNKIYF